MDPISTVDALVRIDLEHTGNYRAYQAVPAMRDLLHYQKEAQMTVMAIMVLFKLIEAVLLVVGASFYCLTHVVGFVLAAGMLVQWLLVERKK